AVDSSVPTNLFPRDVLVDVGLTREAEDALADLVAQNLARPPFDRVRPRPQESAGLLRPAQIGRLGHGAGAGDVHLQLRLALVPLGIEHLGDRTFGTGLRAGLAALLSACSGDVA